MRMLSPSQVPRFRLQPITQPRFGGDHPTNLFEIISFLRRQRAIIAVITTLMVLGALVYGLTATRRYTATTLVLVDPGNTRVFPDQVVAPDSPNSATIDSLVEVFKSERVLRPVVKKLELLQDPEFANPPAGSLNTMCA